MAYNDIAVDYCGRGQLVFARTDFTTILDVSLTVFIFSDHQQWSIFLYTMYTVTQLNIGINHKYKNITSYTILQGQ